MFKHVAASCIAAISLLLPVSMTHAATYTDVPPTHSLFVEIDYLSNKGVIKGYEDGTFQPNAPIAKKHIAKMLVEALNLPTTTDKILPYKDVPTTHPYYQEIAAVYKAGIFSKADYFKPDSSISRAFMAKILAQSFKLDGDVAQTFEDVGVSNEFFKPIALVASHHIARGYEAEDGTATFLPHRLLTRAHFSAFLARAMSMQTGAYIPDEQYTYFYTHDDEPLRLELAYADELYNLWNVFSNTNELKTEIDYEMVNGRWMLFLHDDIIRLDYPFTVGTKHTGVYDDPSETLAIIETNGTYTIAGQTYRNVVVVHEAYRDFKGNGELLSRTLYIAKGYGIIGIEQRGTFTTALTKRTLR